MNRLIFYILLFVLLILAFNISYSQNIKIDNIVLPDSIGLSYLFDCYQNPDTIPKLYVDDNQLYPEYEQRNILGKV